MCRLLYIPPQSGISRKALCRLCEYLETACGGDGNGAAAVKRGTQAQLYKGAKVPAHKLGAMLWAWSQDGYHGVFHTRKATHGSISDDNCQPFIARGTALAHNGIWQDGATIGAAMLPDYSDSRVLAHLWHERGPKWLREESTLWPPSGVWLFVGIKSQRVRVPSGMFSDMSYDPRSGVWASQFPKCKPFKSAYDVASGTHALHVRGGKAKAPAAASYGFATAAYTTGSKAASIPPALDAPRAATDYPLSCDTDSDPWYDHDKAHDWPSRPHVYGVDDIAGAIDGGI